MPELIRLMFGTSAEITPTGRRHSGMTQTSSGAGYCFFLVNGN
ncbi:hypothetical protein RSSM_05506 [Rhodopirellula sallentina SM41]|uniref:Uncharacterized protein n=1 Tax=Rhodopirellula sallentina SM41 TaxID=1263870 RepID=M5TV21_9BACT|nr:hypothetical protein RSSM_05506 [Rhodopirellula sallentina SM41]